MWKALRRAGEQVPRCRVQRLMRSNGIVGAKRRGKPWRTTTPDPQAARRPDLVQRDFKAAGPNALAESFVDSFKTELITDRVWRKRSQLELAVVEYTGWYNAARLHESLGDIPPTEFEQQHRQREPITLVGATV